MRRVQLGSRQLWCQEADFVAAVSCGEVRVSSDAKNWRFGRLSSPDCGMAIWGVAEQPPCRCSAP